VPLLPFRYTLGARGLRDLPSVFLGRWRPRRPRCWVGPGRSKRLAFVASGAGQFRWVRRLRRSSPQKRAATFRSGTL